MSLSDADKLARFAHKDQTDKSGADYYQNHLVPVTRIVRDRGGSQTVQTVAMLHDSIEDTFVTHEYLAHFIDPFVADAVEHLSRDSSKETYVEFIERIATLEGYIGDVVRAVKIADIIDHLRDTTHIKPSLVERYVKAAIRLGVAEEIGYDR